MQLQIKNLNVSIDNKNVLKDFNLTIDPSTIHALMGPNGVGKSTLSRVIMGDVHYKVDSGDILVDGKSILSLTTDKRSKLGIFLAMQYPLEIEGISNQDFLRTAISSKEGKSTNLYDFILKCEQMTNELHMDKSLIQRDLNVGFSGGEKKKNELLQIKLLKPSLIILDELDSGLDIDSLKVVVENINKYIEDNPETSLLIITHHNQVLEHIHPDYVHLMLEGHIIKSGDYTLAQEIEKKGYTSYLNKTNVIGDINDGE